MDRVDFCADISIKFVRNIAKLLAKNIKFPARWSWYILSQTRSIGSEAVLSRLTGRHIWDFQYLSPSTQMLGQ
jgi:hypothetical protein